MSKATRIKLKKWHEAVRERDDWTCQYCVDRFGIEPAIGNLQSHHVGGRVGSLKLDIDNGIYLCYACHCEAHDHPKRFNDWFEEKYPARAKRIRELK